ncbi:MAG: Rrf2 family transcriptional regulator [Planctomycetia bacterium]|nr:Rrf2 family transcriptional regulator [Planctomycetia bacterium]
MKISSQEEYGLRCLLRLAKAEENGQSLTIQEIAGGEALSSPYVAKLLAVLRNGGIIESARGRAGGYRLSAPPADIRLGAVLMTLGEPLFDEPSYCERHKGTETEGSCVHHGGCNLRAVWLTLENWMRLALDQVSLADLLRGEQHIADLLRARLLEAIQEPTALAAGRHSLSLVSDRG